jgi:ferredoxin
MTKEVEVVFQPEGTHARIESGQTILEAARLAGVDLVSVCGGKGDCGKCRVIVTERKNIGPLTKIERQLL